MITGELKNRIDSLWDDFAAGGIVNPLTVIEQITYLMFIHDLDEADNKGSMEASAPLSTITIAIEAKIRPETKVVTKPTTKGRYTGVLSSVNLLTNKKATAAPGISATYSTPGIEVVI